MNDATKERLRLDARHDDELRRIGKTQEQKREHIAQIQAQALEHRKLMLDLEHKAVHDAVVARQKALDKQKYEHRERILMLERQYAVTGVADEPRGLVIGSDNSGSRNEAAVVQEEPLTVAENIESENAGSENVGSENEDSGDKTSKENRLDKDWIIKRAERRRTAKKTEEEGPRRSGDTERPKLRSI